MAEAPGRGCSAARFVREGRGSWTDAAPATLVSSRSSAAGNSESAPPRVRCCRTREYRGERSLTLLPQRRRRSRGGFAEARVRRAASAWTGPMSSILHRTQKHAPGGEVRVQELGERGAVHRQRGEDVLRLLTKVVVHDSGRRTDFARARVRRARDGAETWTSLPILNGRLTCSKRRRGRDDSRNRSSPSRRRGRFVFVVAARGWWTRHTATRATRPNVANDRLPARAPGPGPRLNLRRRCPAVVRSRSSPKALLVSSSGRRWRPPSARVPPPPDSPLGSDLPPSFPPRSRLSRGDALTEFPSALVAHRRPVSVSRAIAPSPPVSIAKPRACTRRPSPAPPTTARSTPTAAPPTSPSATSTPRFATPRAPSPSTRTGPRRTTVSARALADAGEWIRARRARSRGPARSPRTIPPRAHAEAAEYEASDLRARAVCARGGHAPRPSMTRLRLARRAARSRRARIAVAIKPCAAPTGSARASRVASHVPSDDAS